MPHHVQAVALDAPSLRRADQVMGIKAAHIIDRIALFPSLGEKAALHGHERFGLIAVDLG